MTRLLLRLTCALPALLGLVVACGSPRSSTTGRVPGVHAPGILDPQDRVGFHGALLRSAGWDFRSCTVCHGADFAGTVSGPSCLTCHPGGPTTCDTCHGPQLGDAHPAHVGGLRLGRGLGCVECHPTPQSYRDPGHLFEADGSVRTSAVRLQFGPLAGLSAPRGIRLPAPSFAVGDRGCDNMYCHGAPFGDGNATLTRPLWRADASQAACGTCHGLPPRSHDPAQTRCVLCHNRSVDGQNHLIPGGLHLDGRVDLGDGSGTCYACHGSSASLAPPRDIVGNRDISAIGVGVHQSHLQATHRLRGTLACSDCHAVPSRVDSPGHILPDQPAPVFPTGSGPLVLAQADGAQPRWDRGTARCSDVYCHGGGRKLSADTAAGLRRTPLWTQTGEAYCGACHGIPPRDAAHVSTLRLTDCVNCHPATMDALGTLLVTGLPGAETSAHINGVVDVR
jgi:predicted CxxxxCH...CXXCH cytochrome family protein